MRVFIIVLIGLFLASCQNQDPPPTTDNQELPAGNLLSELTSKGTSNLKWLNQPNSFSIENNTMKVVAEKGTDYFNNPEDGSIASTAPLLYKQVKGDFVAKALVRPDFSSMWNAVSIMVHIDSLNWIKFAFENSDATGQSIVSVVTKNVSDDANGAILSNHNQIWLKLIRKGNIYSMLWSIEDKDYKMARLTAMPPVDSLKVGIEAQCPVGDSASHEMLYFGIESKTVGDLRNGE